MKVYISATLRSFFGRNGEIEIQKNTIGELLETLTGLYPETGKSLYDENGNIRSFIRIFVDGEDRTDLAYHHEVLGDNSEVLLLPLIAGGAPEGSIISDDRRKAVSLDDSEIERMNSLSARWRTCLSVAGRIAYVLRERGISVRSEGIFPGVRLLYRLLPDYLSQEK